MSEPAEYGLVMPFVVVQSAGEPYDDDSFASGFHAGRIDVWLKVLPVLEMLGGEFATPPEMVRSALVPQLDLIAMRHGFLLTAKPWDEHPDEWTEVTFTKGTGL